MRLRFRPCILAIVRRTKDKLKPGEAPNPETPAAEGGQSVVPEVPGGAAEDQLQSKEIGGPEGLEPTRYGDWERKGRCIDF